MIVQELPIKVVECEVKSDALLTVEVNSTASKLAIDMFNILKGDQKFARLMKLVEALPLMERKLNFFEKDSFHLMIRAFVDRCIEEVYFA